MMDPIVTAAIMLNILSTLFIIADIRFGSAQIFQVHREKDIEGIAQEEQEIRQGQVIE